jgi:hypothetical protein
MGANCDARLPVWRRNGCLNATQDQGKFNWQIAKWGEPQARPPDIFNIHVQKANRAPLGQPWPCPRANHGVVNGQVGVKAGRTGDGTGAGSQTPWAMGAKSLDRGARANPCAANPTQPTGGVAWGATFDTACCWDAALAVWGLGDEHPAVAHAMEIADGRQRKALSQCRAKSGHAFGWVGGALDVPAAQAELRSLTAGYSWLNMSQGINLLFSIGAPYYQQLECAIIPPILESRYGFSRHETISPRGDASLCWRCLTCLSCCQGNAQS